jgi:PAS domain S-box-containing protein
MATLDGSKFPPLHRSLNDREKEQLRISKIQQRQFRSNNALAVEAGEKEQEQRRSNSEQRRQDRESLFRAIGEDQEIHNSMAYSLAMAMDLDDSKFLPISRSLKNKEKKEQLSAKDQMRHDRMVATQQLYGDHTPINDTKPPMTGDNLDLDVDDYDDDSLSMTYSPSFASSLNDGSSQFPSLTRSLNKRESEQLRISKDQLISKCTSKCTYPEQRRRQHPLPRTLQDALLPSSEAIVVTETKMPFRVFNVNEAWEGLCGYSNVESKGKSLGTLLGGKETDHCAVTALIHQLFVHGEEATTVLTNYTKDGRKFRNRLSVGPLYDEETNEVSHFVGILKEVSVAA